MDFYPYVIQIYVEKKTVKEYKTLEDFHNDLSQFKYQYMYDVVHEYSATLSKLNETDFTFLVCKLIDESEYSSAYSVVAANIRYNNQQIQNKFKEHMNKYPEKFQTKIPPRTLEEKIRYQLFRITNDEDFKMEFNCMLTDTPLRKTKDNSGIKIEDYFNELGKIVDLEKIIYYKTDKCSNNVNNYIDAFSGLNYRNQHWVISTLIKKNAVSDIEGLRLVALYRNMFDEQETEIYNQLSDKILGFSDLKKENQELKDKNLELEKKLNEIQKLL